MWFKSSSRSQGYTNAIQESKYQPLVENDDDK
jgi:hypothetical protein